MYIYKVGFMSENNSRFPVTQLKLLFLYFPDRGQSNMYFNLSVLDLEICISQ